MTQNVSKGWTIAAGDYIREIDECDRIGKMRVTKQTLTQKLFVTLLSGAALGLAIFSISLISKF